MFIELLPWYFNITESNLYEMDIQDKKEINCYLSSPS